jgi:AmmeMemoRadiSam system protein B
VNHVHPPMAAGRFYPAHRCALAATVDGLLAAAGPPSIGRRPVALIAPHGGYRYSGPIAASAYALLTPWSAAVCRVVILGPSHIVDFDGAALPAATALRTPLGDVPVEPLDGTYRHDQPHAREHSIEVQLPFLQRVLAPGWTCSPVALGQFGPHRVADLLEGLPASDTLVVCSTDLSHYQPHQTAQKLDRHTASAIIDRDPDGIGPRDACGRIGLRGLLVWARRHDLLIDLLDLRTSGDISTDRSSVVGYGAFAAYTS